MAQARQPLTPDLGVKGSRVQISPARRYLPLSGPIFTSSAGCGSRGVSREFHTTPARAAPGPWPRTELPSVREVGGAVTSPSLCRTPQLREAAQYAWPDGCPSASTSTRAVSGSSVQDEPVRGLTNPERAQECHRAQLDLLDRYGPPADLGGVGRGPASIEPDPTGWPAIALGSRSTAMIVGWTAPASYGREGEATASRACRPDAAHVDDEPAPGLLRPWLMILRSMFAGRGQPQPGDHANQGQRSSDAALDLAVNRKVDPSPRTAVSRVVRASGHQGSRQRDVPALADRQRHAEE